MWRLDKYGTFSTITVYSADVADDVIKELIDEGKISSKWHVYVEEGRKVGFVDNVVNKRYSDIEKGKNNG